MAGFQVILHGRFWVFTEADGVTVGLLCPSGVLLYVMGMEIGNFYLLHCLPHQCYGESLKIRFLLHKPYM